MPLIKKPTRITCHKASLLDNIFTSVINETEPFQGILYADVSDNFTVFVIYKDMFLNKNEFIFTRKFSHKNIDKFKSQLQETDWLNTVFSADEAQQGFSSFHNNMKNRFDMISVFR